MRQQINLYQDVLVAKKVPLHAGIIFSIFIGCGLLLVLASVAINWQQGKLASELSALNRQQTELSARLQLLSVQNPPRQKDPLLVRTLQQKQDELARRQPLLAYLDRFKSGKDNGFSSLVKGLAQNRLQGVWLTGIRLNTLEQKILLAGSAISAELIPAYIEHLGQKQVLKGQTFASLKLSRVQEDARRIDFRLESEFGVTDE
jgi:hypothetical protein